MILEDYFNRAPWMVDAACLDHHPDLHFPIAVGRASVGRTLAAKTVCSQCIVREPCLTYALDNNELYGVWGGVDEDERATIRRGVN